LIHWSFFDNGNKQCIICAYENFVFVLLKSNICNDLQTIRPCAATIADFVLTKNLEVEKVETEQIDFAQQVNLDRNEEPTEVVADCKAQAAHRLEQLSKTQDNSNELKEQILKDLHVCTTTRLAPRFKAVDDELTLERLLRVQASFSAENFTCTDTGLESSPDVRQEDWISPKDGMTRTVHIKLDRPASRIHVIENFASVEECDAMEAEASKRLGVASTADGKGGTKISPGRKAMQAGIHPKFTPNGEARDGNLIAVLSGRVYEYVNHVLNLNITHHGQEPLMSIQYFGRGYNDTEPDRYTPHCDGKCEGNQHMVGARMATMVIYWYVVHG
jgi:hypothetical protein